MFGSGLAIPSQALPEQSAFGVWEGIERRSVRVQVPPPAPTFHAYHAGKQRARWSRIGALGWEPSSRNVSLAGNVCYPKLFLLTIRLMLDATGMMAPDSIGMRVVKIQKNKYENTDGPDIAQPTGKHRPPYWFLA